MTIGQRVEVTFWGQTRQGTVEDMRRPNASIVFVRLDGSKAPNWFHVDSLAPLTAQQESK